VFALAVALVPLFVTSGFLLNVVIMTLYATLLGQAWNILGGFGGQFSFGHAVFFGTGAYAMAVLQARFGINAWLALPVALALGAAVGVLVGSLSFRYGLKGSYFALVTLAFAEVFRILANNFQFTGAGVGIQIKLADSAAEMQFATKAGFLYAALVLATASLLVAWWLRRSARTCSTSSSSPSPSRARSWLRAARSTFNISATSTRTSPTGRRSRSRRCSRRSWAAWARCSGRSPVRWRCTCSERSRAGCSSRRRGRA
jgi:hypothetical protein